MAFRRLGELAGPDEIPSLVGSLFKATAQNDLDAIERALATMAGRPENSEKTGGADSLEYRKSQHGSKNCLITGAQRHRNSDGVGHYS